MPVRAVRKLAPERSLRDVLIASPVIHIDDPLAGEIHGNTGNQQVLVDRFLRGARPRFFENHMKMVARVCEQHVKSDEGIFAETEVLTYQDERNVRCGHASNVATR